jgi:glycosyltransferase involved in cell wall biosynthesis
VFTAPADGEAPDAGGALVHRIRPLVAIGNAPLIPAIARIEGFDVVHLHYPFIFGAELTLLGRATSRRRRTAALVVHYKNRLVGKGPRAPLFAAYEHTVSPMLIRSADRICVLSADHADSVPYVRAARRRAPERLVEMPNGVDTERFSPGSSPALRERLGIGADAIVAAFVATLDRAHHFKRLDVAIEALARERAGDVHLLVAGGGELLDDYRAQAQAAGLGERVHFLGRVSHDELPGVLRAADFMLLTTEPPESFGIVLIEAMACGLPAVATDYPGVRAVVEPEVNGLLVPRGDVAGVADAVGSMARMQPGDRRRMGEAGRAKCEREWTWPRLVERFDGVYRGAIEARSEKQGDAAR